MHSETRSLAALLLRVLALFRYIFFCRRADRMPIVTLRPLVIRDPENASGLSPSRFETRPRSSRNSLSRLLLGTAFVGITRGRRAQATEPARS